MQERGNKAPGAEGRSTPAPGISKPSSVGAATPEKGTNLAKQAQSDFARAGASVGVDSELAASVGPTRTQQSHQEKLKQLDPEAAQLDWFVFETRIRKVVYDLLDSPIESIKASAKRQDELAAALDTTKRRIDEHDFLLFKFQKRTEMEAEYEQRIQRMETAVNT